MIPTLCPACGRKGNVPENKVNTRLHCKKCDAVFHINPAGISLLGEPETEETRARKHARAAEASARLDPIDEAVKRVKRLPKPVQYGTGLTCVALTAVFLLPAFGIRVLPEPETPESVASRAAHALLVGDSRTLQRLSTPATSAEVSSWLTQRATLFPGLSDGPEPRSIIEAKPVAAAQPKASGVRDDVSVLVLADPKTKIPQIFVSFPIDLVKSGRSWKVDVSSTRALPPTIRPDDASGPRR